MAFLSYCAKHLSLHPEVTRPAGKRGYTRQWQKISRQYLQSHPLCAECMRQGRYTKATVVDHITPHRGDPRLFWDEANWQPMCKQCHDRKTLTQDIHPVYLIRSWHRRLTLTGSNQTFVLILIAK